jgi:alpha/beta superfamily hydrolase
VATETVLLETIDGINIEAHLRRTDTFPASAVVIMAHPHPLHGGDSNNHVVRAMQDAAEELGCHSIAVDFRGVGNSGGFFDDGDSERLDLAAACELADMVESDCPIVMAGYSFGALVGLNVTNPWIHGWIAIAPPLLLGASAPIAATNPRPKVLIVPEHDQFCAPEQAKTSAAQWNNTEIRTIAGIDHFMAVGANLACLDALRFMLEKI